MKSNRIFDLVNDMTMDDIPEILIKDVKEQILDTIGFAMDGVTKEGGHAGIGRIVASSVSGEASIIGDGTKISTKEAFRVNSYLSHLGDYGGVGYHIPYHPGRLVVNATLAAGEKLDAGTLEFKVPVPAGAEVKLTYRIRVSW